MRKYKLSKWIWLFNKIFVFFYTNLIINSNEGEPT